MDSVKDNPSMAELDKNTSRMFELMGIKQAIRHIECERDLRLKPRPPNQCIYRLTDGNCEPINIQCKNCYPDRCVFVVKYAHYKKYCTEGEKK